MKSIETNSRNIYGFEDNASAQFCIEVAWCNFYQLLLSMKFRMQKAKSIKTNHWNASLASGYKGIGFHVA